MLRAGGGGANLPVCCIFKRGIDVYSSFSPRSGEAEFVQLFPLQVSHAAEQSNPPHLHLFFKEHFFFCGRTVKYEGRNRGYDVIPVHTKDFQDKIQESCKVRNGEWAEAVRERLEFAHDLHAADAVHHQARAVSTFEWENRFQRSMGMILIQSVQRDILRIQKN